MYFILQKIKKIFQKIYNLNFKFNFNFNIQILHNIKLYESTKCEKLNSIEY